MIPLGVLAGSQKSMLEVFYSTALVDISNGTSYTFYVSHTGFSTDVIVLGVVSEGSAATLQRDLTLATFDGITTAPVAYGNHTSGVAGLYAVSGYGPGTYPFAVNFSGEMARAALGVWVVTGPSATLSDTASAASPSATGVSMTVDVLAGNVAVVVYTSGNHVNHSYSGAIEDFDLSPEGQTTEFSGAHVGVLSSNRINHLITITHANSAQPVAGAVAVFGSTP